MKPTCLQPLTLVLLLSLMSCSNPKPDNKVYQLDPKSWPTKTTSSDRLIQELRIVPLETTTECLIDGIDGFEQNSRGFYVLTHSMQIMHFDLNGGFQWTLNKKGQGPGEYLYLSGFTISDKELILMDLRGKKILFFDLDGHFLKEITHVATGFEIACLDKDVYAILHGRVGSRKVEKTELSLINTDGKVLHSWVRFENPDAPGQIFSNFTHGLTDRSILFNPELDPVIYQVTASGIDTVASFDFGQPICRSFKQLSESKDFIEIKKIVNTQNTLLAIFQAKSGDRHFWILDHKSGKTKLFSDEKEKGILGYYENFPIEFPQWSNGDEFIYSLNAIDFKETGLPGSENLKEDDNPVLVLYKVRDF